MKPSLSILMGLVAYLSSVRSLCVAGENAKRPAGIVLNGVVAEFAVHPRTFTHADNVQVTVRLANVTEKSVTFRYICCIESHIELNDSNGKFVSWKRGAPVPECPYREIEIKAGKTVERKESFDFGRFYAVQAGDYALAFKYDLRLMKRPDPGQDPWVPWSKSRLKVTVK